MYTIAMIAPTPFFADRGCHVRIYEETRALQKLGNNVAIYTYHHGRDMSGIKIKRIMNVSWYKKLEAGPSCHKPYLDLLLLLKVLESTAGEKPDIIHAHLHEGAFLGKIYKKFKNIPLVFDFQGSLTTELVDHNFLKEGSFIFKFVRKIEDSINRSADAIVVSSTNSANLLREESNIKKHKIFAVLDGVNVDEFKPHHETSDLKRKLNLPLNKKIVVYLGLLNKYQGIDCLLEAIGYLVKKNENVHFLIMGYPDVEKYKKMAAEKRINHNVTFAGRIDYRKAPQYLSLGDVAVSSKISKTESNGKVYNYMAMGLPTVVFDTPVNREILGNLGVYAKLNNPVSLAEKLEVVLSNGNLAKNLGKKLREKAVDGYSWQAVGKKLMNIYQTISKK
ncbi:D-inositol-3-phosphate glycosyltransferase [subsurface metagenome]